MRACILHMFQNLLLKVWFELGPVESAFGGSEHQEKTCEDITPYGVITQFPKNGRLFTPKYRFITPSTFDHTEKNLFTPSILKITPS